MITPNSKPSLLIPVPISEIPTLLKGVDSTAGKYFKEALMVEIEKNLHSIAKKGLTAQGKENE